jgi:hypothetical protein
MVVDFYNYSRNPKKIKRPIQPCIIKKIPAYGQGNHYFEKTIKTNSKLLIFYMQLIEANPYL